MKYLDLSNNKLVDTINWYNLLITFKNLYVLDLSNNDLSFKTNLLYDETKDNTKTIEDGPEEPEGPGGQDAVDDDDDEKQDDDDENDDDDEEKEQDDGTDDIENTDDTENTENTENTDELILIMKLMIL